MKKQNDILLNRAKKRLISTWSPGWAVISASGIVRQISQHRDSLRCVWQSGESIVEGRIYFLQKNKRKKK